MLQNAKENTTVQCSREIKIPVPFSIVVATFTCHLEYLVSFFCYLYFQMYNGVLYIVLISLFAVLFNLNKMFELETVMLEKRSVDRGQDWVCT